MRQVFITGASRGIGAAIARKLGVEGYRVWLHFRSREDAAREVARSITAAGGPEPLLTQFDLADRATATDTVRRLVETEGAPDALVCNAGVNRDGLFVFTDDASWDEVIDTNLTGFFAVAKPVVKAMLRRRSGRVVLLSSIAAQRGSPGQVNYAASKGGLISAARSLALEVAPRGVTVNVVSPGLVETEMLKDAPLAQLMPLIPLSRLGTPEEVAHVVGYLCSEESAYMTGQVLSVNGGMWM